jgi:hemoglobin
MPPTTSKDSLYSRLGGYDAIAAVADDLLPRLRSDRRLQRFWTSPRSIDTNNRERQLLVDFISASAGGPTFYLGRDMKTSHKGMGIDQADYTALKKHLLATLEKFNVPERHNRRTSSHCVALWSKASPFSIMSIPPIRLNSSTSSRALCLSERSAY